MKKNDTGAIAVVIADAITSIIIDDNNDDDDDDDVNGDIQGGLEMQMISVSIINFETSLSFLSEGEEEDCLWRENIRNLGTQKGETCRRSITTLVTFKCLLTFLMTYFNQKVFVIVVSFSSANINYYL